jgi:hypothetical protein
MIAERRAKGGKPGGAAYLSGFQGAVTEFMEGLDEEKVSELEVKRTEWKNQCHPIDVQRKAVDRMGRSILQKAAESQYKEMGMRSIVWEFHENKAGTKLFQMLSRQIFFVNIYLTKSYSHDFNDNIGKAKVQSFVDRYPDAVNDFRQAWVDYMKYCYEVESGEVESGEVESAASRNRTTTLIDLDRDPKGYPLVPQEGGNLANMRHIIRSFVTTHYRKSINNFSFTVLISLNPQVLLPAGNRIGSHGNKLKNTRTISLIPNISPIL